MRGVGAIVETPALFPTMSGRENLTLLGAIDHIGSKRVDDALEEVGLSERADDQVKKYSLGMRQRLALAAALLKDPALLILDEPANGLDPAGMRSVRELLRRLASEGRTVFVSSHLLAEIQQTCDRVAILNRGRCVTHGTVEEVSAAAGHAAAMLVGRRRSRRRARGARPRGHPGRARATATSASRSPHRTRHGSARTLGEQGHWVRELRREERSLEDLFLEMTDDRGENPTRARGGRNVNLLKVEMRRAMHRARWSGC